MEALPPIPTPPAQRWREFRIQVLPVLVFLVTTTAIAVMWHNFVLPSGVVGQVEVVTNSVITAFDGTLTNLSVDRFDYVTNGQVLGIVEVVDPEVHDAGVAAIPANLEVVQARMAMNRTAGFNNYSTKRIEMLREQLAFELAQTQLIQAEADLKRQSNLYAAGAISEGIPLENQYNRIDSGYVVFDRYRQHALPGLVSWLKKHGITTAGRYGAWTYCSMEDNILEGRAIAEALG